MLENFSMLVDELLKIDKLEPTDRTAACVSLYKNNIRYRQYADLCYRGDVNISSESLPKINYDNVPLGLHLTSLEMVYKDFKVVAYNRDINPERCMQRFLQICESISRTEVYFLIEVIDGGLKWFDYQDWKVEYLSRNNNQ